METPGTPRVSEKGKEPWGRPIFPHILMPKTGLSVSHNKCRKNASVSEQPCNRVVKTLRTNASVSEHTITMLNKCDKQMRQTNASVSEHVIVVHT